MSFDTLNKGQLKFADSPRFAQARPPSNVPRHVAIIMDGNGRWAKSRGLPRPTGHRAGAKAVRRCTEAAVDLGVEWLTLFAFSTENWNRPENEVIELNRLLRHYIRSEVTELNANDVRWRFIGDRGRFTPDLQAEFDHLERLTERNRRLNLTIALSYSGRDEIVAATRSIAEAVRAGIVQPADVNEAHFKQFLWTSTMPDPDLIIRTSGEKRISNFLLWQCAYSEFVFLETLWPDFQSSHFKLALEEFASRDRRYGKVIG